LRPKGIKVVESDIGRAVVYRTAPNFEPEQGVITSFNAKYVNVRYGNSIRGVATDPADLDWAFGVDKAPAISEIAEPVFRDYRDADIVEALATNLRLADMVELRQPMTAPLAERLLNERAIAREIITKLRVERDRLKASVDYFRAGLEQIVADDDGEDCCGDLQPNEGAPNYIEGVCCGKPVRGIDRAREIARAMINMDNMP